MATASASLELPVLHGTTITEASIDADRVEFECRAREAAASDVGIDFDDVVIAEHQSSEQFDQVPDDWLRDLRVLLRADDTLVTTKLETNQYRGACSALRSEVRKSVRANGLFDHTIVPLPHGALVTPDVLINERANDPCRRDVPVVLFDGEVHGRSIQHVIGTAAFYLSDLTKDERVVPLQFFPPLQPDLNENGQLHSRSSSVQLRRAAVESKSSRRSRSAMRRYLRRR